MPALVPHVTGSPPDLVMSSESPASPPSGAFTCQRAGQLRKRDCFAEPVIGPAKGRTRWLAMTADCCAVVFDVEFLNGGYSGPG